MISIVVPVYNAQQFIGETIQSVLQQTYEQWELLLVNDCSTDESAAVINEYCKQDERIRLIDQPNNFGAAAARNRGVKEALGRYIAYLDADDLWLPQKLQNQINFLKKKKCGFVFTGYEFADETGVGMGKIVQVPNTLTYRQALKNTTIFTSTVLFDTTIISKQLIQMPQVKSEDTATWWNILKHGFTAYGLQQNLVLYRRSKNTLSSNKMEAIKRIWYLYRKVEGLSLITSAYNFTFYAIRAVLRRV